MSRPTHVAPHAPRVHGKRCLSLGPAQALPLGGGRGETAAVGLGTPQAFAILASDASLTSVAHFSRSSTATWHLLTTSPAGAPRIVW